jgi:DNA-binding XRE family transcriptional regulator
LLLVIVENIPWTASLAIRILRGVNKQFRQSQINLANRVKALRAERGLSQEKLAFEADIDRTYASQIERAIGNPSLRVICAIATVLEVELIDLMKSDKT